MTTVRRSEKEEDIRIKRKKHHGANRCIVTSFSMNLSQSNLGANISFTPFLYLDPTSPSFDDLDPKNNNEKSKVSWRHENQERRQRGTRRRPQPFLYSNGLFRLLSRYEKTFDISIIFLLPTFFFFFFFRQRLQKKMTVWYPVFLYKSNIFLYHCRKTTQGDDKKEVAFSSLHWKRKFLRAVDSLKGLIINLWIHRKAIRPRPRLVSSSTQTMENRPSIFHFGQHISQLCVLVNPRDVRKQPCCAVTSFFMHIDFDA